jgi:molybdenum cofactor cytidylyltransferase
MGDSIAAAVRATQDAPGWLVLPGDLPLVLPQTLLTVAQALRDESIVVPSYQGERGHPVAFGARFRPELLRLSGPQGAAAIVRANRPSTLELDDVGVVTDVDTAEALAAASDRFFARFRSSSRKSSGSASDP